MIYCITDECVVCWKCMTVCPEGAVCEAEVRVTRQHSVPSVVIDQEKCTSCGLCLEACPMEAIKLG